MDIYQTLHKDHEEVANLFTRIEGLSSGAVKSRERLFGELKSALERHSRAEEKVFYPELKKNESSHFRALESAQEHHVIDLMLKEISALSATKEEWMAKLAVLKEQVTHHVDQEEHEVFPQARTFIDEAKANDLAIKFEEQKKRIH